MGGSSSTQRTQIPDYMSDASRLAVQRANQIFEAGRMPYTGIDVVGINPSEKAAMENVASAASAFGMAVPQGDPFAGMEAQTTNGLTGYSSMPIYISDMQRLKEQRPDQYAAFAKLTGFDPITGEAIAPPAPAMSQAASSSGGGGGNDDDPLERHYSLFPNERPTTGPYAIDHDAIAHKQFVDDQLNLLHDGNHGEMFKASLEQGLSDFKSPVAKLFGKLTGG